MPNVDVSNKPRYFDPDGNPMTVEEWGVLFEKRKLADTSWWKRSTTAEASDGEVITISTVWLGLDHAWEGEPRTWETMVFTEGGSNDIIQRYGTREAAWAGHEELCRDLFEGRQEVL